MRILYVEDEEVMREVFKMMFKPMFDFKLVEVFSGNQAIKLLESDQSFDLIISDYSMKDGNGGDLLKHLINQNYSIPFALFSNTVDPEIDNSYSNYLGLITKTDYAGLIKAIKPISTLK